jgi:type II secretory pathway pseudopilin PulG
MTLAPARRRRHGRSRQFRERWLLGQNRGRLRSHEDAGFTLIETLAAFTVLTLVLIVLLGDLSGVVGGSRDAEAKREALRLAQSKLDVLGVTEPLIPGESTGRFDNGFAWHLRIRGQQEDTNAYLKGAWAEITVSAPADGARRPPAVSLVTFKLVSAPRK